MHCVGSRGENELHSSQILPSKSTYKTVKIHELIICTLADAGILTLIYLVIPGISVCADKRLGTDATVGCMRRFLDKRDISFLVYGR